MLLYIASKYRGMTLQESWSPTVRRMVDEQEQREKAAWQVHAWVADLAAEFGGRWVPTTNAFTGEFREDGVLVPAGEPGFSIIPPYRVGAVASRDYPDGFVVQLLFYSAPRDSYVVVEVVWAEEPEPPAAYPVGKPHPDGSAPLRWVEEGEDVPEGCMVVWDDEERPCPSRCRTYPEDALESNQWLTEEDIREQFPQLWE
jgi:hypothetical protein